MCYNTCMSSQNRISENKQAHIRDATFADAEAIVELVRALALFEESGDASFTADDFLKYGFGEKPSFRVIVAESGNKLPHDKTTDSIIGFLMYYEGYDLASASHGTHLADIFVHENARGQGAGRALIRELAQRTLAAGGQWVSWTVLKKNRAAKKFYTDLGASNVNVDFMAWGASALTKLAQ